MCVRVCKILSASRSMTNCCRIWREKKVSLLCVGVSVGALLFLYALFVDRGVIDNRCALSGFPRISNVAPYWRMPQCPYRVRVCFFFIFLIYFSACRRLPTSQQQSRMRIVDRGVGCASGRWLSLPNGLFSPFVGTRLVTQESPKETMRHMCSLILGRGRCSVATFSNNNNNIAGVESVNINMSMNISNCEAGIWATTAALGICRRRSRK